MEPVDHQVASGVTPGWFAARRRTMRRFNQWYLRYPTTPRRLLILGLAAAATISLVMLVVVTVSNPQFRYKNSLLLWCVEYPVFFSLVQAPRNYKKARRLAGVAPDRLERVARVLERALVAVLIGGAISVTLLLGAVSAPTALVFWPIFSLMVFGFLLLILEPSEGVSRPRFLQSRYMPMRRFLSCNANERRLVTFALAQIYSLNRSRESLDSWGHWTSTTRAAVLEWIGLLSAMGSGFVAMTVVLAPRSITSANQIGYFFAVLSLVVIAVLIKGAIVIHLLRRSSH